MKLLLLLVSSFACLPSFFFSFVSFSPVFFLFLFFFVILVVLVLVVVVLLLLLLLLLRPDITVLVDLA